MSKIAGGVCNSGKHEKIKIKMAILRVGLLSIGEDWQIRPCGLEKTLRSYINNWLVVYGYEPKIGYGTLRGDPDVWNEELSGRVLFQTLFKRRLRHKHRNKYIYIYLYYLNIHVEISL